MTAARRVPAAAYPIRAVARMTGISVDTLRAWERRYEAVVPGRGGRGRVYTDADVTRLRTLGQLVRRGHAIGTIAGLQDRHLRQLLAGTNAHEARRTGQDAGDAALPAAELAPLLSAVDRYDVDAMETALNRFAVVLPPRDLVAAVVLPLLREVGTRWEDGRLRPAQEHLVSSVVRSVLGGLLRASARPDASPKAVFATLAGERHELGLIAAALLAASAGVGVVYLGPDLPAADIAHAATTAGAEVVVLGLTAPERPVRPELRKLSTLAKGTALWLGGPLAAASLNDAGAGARLVPAVTDLAPMLAGPAG